METTCELRTEKPWRGDEGPGFNSRRLHRKRTFYKVERPLFPFRAWGIVARLTGGASEVPIFFGPTVKYFLLVRSLVRSGKWKGRIGCKGEAMG